MSSILRRFGIALRKLTELHQEDTAETKKQRGHLRRAIRAIWQETSSDEVKNSIRNKLFESLASEEIPKFIGALSASRSLIAIDEQLRNRILGLSIENRLLTLEKLAIIRCLEYGVKDPRVKQRLFSLLDQTERLICKEALWALLSISEEHEDVAQRIDAIRVSGSTYLKDVIREFEERLDDMFLTFFQKKN